MSTATIIKLVRWRVREMAACFYACKLPPIDGPDCSTSTDQVPKKKMVFDPIGESSRRETNRQKFRRKKGDKERPSIESSKQTRYSKKSEDGRSESNLSNFAEEEYIVFCFRDDGEIQMVKEKKSSGASHHDQKCSRTVNHLVEGEGSNDAEVEPTPDDEIKEINFIGTCEGRTLSSMLSTAESSDSNQSDASTGSFAFPVLGREWMGSPVHMPKPDDIRLRKNKARVVRLHCCRF